MIRAFLLGVALLASAANSIGQFGPGLAQQSAYWGDGKAEFAVYDAMEVRYGEPRKSEIIHILVQEPFSDRELVKAEAGSKAGTHPVLKMNQILHIPTGIYVYQQMHSAFWDVRSGRLVKATLTSNDSCGNTYKEFAALSGWRSWFGEGLRHSWRTYWEGMSEGSEIVRPPAGGIFYDELPMRVRTIDFSSRRSGSFTFPLAGSIIGSKKDGVAFTQATASYDVPAAPPGAPAVIVIAVETGDGKKDVFRLDSQWPHHLREWQKRDGSRLTLRTFLKIDYWNYNRVGDKERALSAGERR